MQIKFYNQNALDKKKYSIIIPLYEGKLVLVKHEKRDTLELPGGHIEKGETAEMAAKRELYEESGATSFELTYLCDYSVEKNGDLGYGSVFMAAINKFGNLPNFEMEDKFLVGEIPENLTYPEIQGEFIRKYLVKNGENFEFKEI
ncbi:MULTISPECIES: NUDIX hydrolase [Psychrilyobacter]|uniref:NUDIX domain-containing protein n=1 Tax=Psychrilyobacter piezotolerans TaxID=2293438 RepID=A0ABX9KGF5_9FUSO|nr:MULTISPECIES: NUDIX domain-containing protein [Psychrilyobacter]MCS5423165.1 NUDIX domain-containing protein [Psychrilyobacter sp. S5]NDI78790.1 NUDIX domain-containing protein [Psychrilyobacter piezotolerans]RDE60889.1 NUDIX domain-containing protein [Psychrilyobacter sp. S5]REI40678.1 NUDIX domain-containing protein [Psychrilyobacter piezotolerans]